VNITWSDIPPANPLAGAVWIDSHVHFDTFDRAGEVERVVDRARAAGVVQMVAIGGSEEANERVVRLAGLLPGTIFGVVGYDRDKSGESNDISAVRDMIRENPGRVVGVGESGLDYHYEPETAPQQRALFAAMLEVAAESALPVVVHSREADADTFDLLRDFTRNWPSDPAGPGSCTVSPAPMNLPKS
jgi:TatD DNase family protein